MRARRLCPWRHPSGLHGSGARRPRGGVLQQNKTSIALRLLGTYLLHRDGQRKLKGVLMERYEAEPTQSLRRNAVGLGGAVIMSAALMGPAVSVYFNPQVA